MSNCVLRIELDEPAAAYLAGETVSGTVIVETSAPVKCSGLEVASRWSTHGRGNIDSGEVEKLVLFTGEWDANREYRYPFRLKSAHWPPTYYGTFLNVSHFVHAQAKVPWSTDPKTQVEFVVAADSSPEDLQPTVAVKSQSSSIIGWIIGAVFLLIFGAMFGVLFLVFLPVILVIAGCYWFFKVFLPKQITGAIECTVEPQRVVAGETIKGAIRFTPKRNSQINGIRWKVTGHEKCTSGSGSNRRTHQHELFQAIDQLAGAIRLAAGQPQSYEFVFRVPENAAPSLKFTDNELAWAGEVRIDIPGWPDWVKTFPLTIVPARQPAGVAPMLGAGSSTASTGGGSPDAEELAWFRQVLDQVLQSQDDPARMETVLSAVEQQEFALQLTLMERCDEVPESVAAEAGTWLLGRLPGKDLDLLLLWPPELEPPFTPRVNWRGRGTIVGYDRDWECLLLRVVS